MPSRICSCNRRRRRNPPRRTWSRAGKGSPNWSSETKGGKEKGGMKKKKMGKVYSSPNGIKRRVFGSNTGSKCVTRAHILRGVKTPSDTISRLQKIDKNKNVVNREIQTNVKSIVSGSPARSTGRLTTVYMEETCQTVEPQKTTQNKRAIL